MSGAPKSTSEEAHEMARLWLDEHVPLAEIGQRYGYTRQGVHLRILQVTGREVLPQRAAQDAARVQARQLERLQERLRKAVPCSVCGCWVIRLSRQQLSKGHATPHRTCSPACAKAWVLLRWVLCDLCREIHALATASTPSRRNDAWSQAKRRGETGSYKLSIHPGSRTHLALMRYRPDLLATVPFDHEIERPQWRRD